MVCFLLSEWWCRNFILTEFCKPCLFLSFFQFAQLIEPVNKSKTWVENLHSQPKFYRIPTRKRWPSPSFWGLMPWQVRGIPLSRLECLVCEWKKDYVLVSSRKNFLLSIFFVFSSCPNIPLFQHVHVRGGMPDNNCWPEFCVVHRSDQSNPLFENNSDRHLPALNNSEDTFQ